VPIEFVLKLTSLGDPELPDGQNPGGEDGQSGQVVVGVGSCTSTELK